MKPQWFFPAAVVSLGFIFSLNVAYAYPAGSTGSTMPLPQLPTNLNGPYNFNFGDSFENLITPFSSFFNSMKNSIGSQPIVGGPVSPVQVQLPNLNNLNGLNNIGNLSGAQILRFILDWILWVLGLAQQFIQWLLGFVH